MYFWVLLLICPVLQKLYDTTVCKQLSYRILEILISIQVFSTTPRVKEL